MSSPSVQLSVGVWHVFAFAPLDRGAASEAIIAEGRVIHERALTPVPQVRRLNQRMNNETVVASWDPQDGTDLHYRLRCLRQGGGVVNLVDWSTPTSAEVSADRLPRGEELRLELQASSGTRSASLLGEPFHLSRLPPDVAILEPADGATLKLGQRTTLRERAVDNQRNPLPAHQLAWSLDGIPLERRRRTVAMACPGMGQHQVTLSFEGDEFDVSTSVDVVVI